MQWFQKHPVHTIFASLSGAGEKLTPRLPADGSRVSHGRASSIFIGEHGVRAIRSLWRYRDSLVRQCAWHTQHMHNTLDQMNIQHHLIAEITGKSGELIVKAILEGERDPNALAAPEDKRLKAPPPPPSARRWWACA